MHEIISLAVLPPSLGEEIFSATAILKVPCGSADYYNSAASGWTQYFVGIEGMCNVTITVTSANENMGTVSGGGEYEFGEEVTITAIPNEGYRFASWNDGNTNNPHTITVTEDATYIASFEEGVGIESRDMLSVLAFYPNPTSGIITFNRNDIMKVEVLDAMGKMVAVDENAYTIDISKLAKGYYAMRITTAEGVAVRKVIRKEVKYPILVIILSHICYSHNIYGIICFWVISFRVYRKVILPEVDGGSALPWVASCSRCWIIISRMGLVKATFKNSTF